jgi:hypothetical protein
MSARLRYVLLSAARSRAPLAPAAISIFAVLGVFAYRGNEVGSTWGLTAVISCALAAWLVGAVLAGEPRAQADMASVALGGRATLEVALVTLVAVVLSASFLTFPLLWSPLGSPPMFVPKPLPVDVVAAAIAHLTCAALGGTLAVLFAPPRLNRPATSAAATLTALIVLVPLGALAGPLAVASAMTDAPRGTIDGPELLACASCVVLAALTLAAAARWSNRVG